MDDPALPGMARCLASLGAFLLIATPLYLMLRYFVRLIRWRYGFDTDGEDDGPPLRICGGCHNTVLEPDFQHCPYCGRLLDAEGDGSVAADDAASGDRTTATIRRTAKRA